MPVLGIRINVKLREPDPAGHPAFVDHAEVVLELVAGYDGRAEKEVHQV
ncbi:hypothetical protein [Bradyrhizobium sp. JR3.5]